MENKLYKDTLLTEKGYEAANAAANAQGSFKITKVVASDNGYDGKSDDELRQLTSLDNEVEGQILDQNSINTKKSAIKTNFTNEIKTDGYVARTVGFYAKYPNGNEFLYSVTPSYNGQIVPSQSTNVFSGFELIVYVLVGNVQKMTVELTPGGDASIDYVNKTVSIMANSLASGVNSNATRVYNLEQKEAGDASAAKSQTGSNALRIYNLEQRESSNVSSLSYMASLNSSVASTYTSAVESDKNNRVSMASYYVDSQNINSKIDSNSNSIIGALNYIKAVEADKNLKTDANFKYIQAVESDKNNRVSMASYANDINDINNNISAAKSQTGSNATRIFNLEQKEAGDVNVAKSQTASNATRIYNLEQKQSGDASAAKSQTGSNAARIFDLEKKENLDISNLNNAIATINNYNNAIKRGISQSQLYHWEVRTVRMANINPGKTLAFFYFPDSGTLRFNGGIQAQAGDVIQLVNYGMYGDGNYLALNNYSQVGIDSSFFNNYPIDANNVNIVGSAPFFAVQLPVTQDGWIDMSQSWLKLKFS